MARMTLDRTGARTVFEELGFRAGAVLHDEVKDRAGKNHDILLMANNVETFLARGDAFGQVARNIQTHPVHPAHPK